MESIHSLISPPFEWAHKKFKDGYKKTSKRFVSVLKKPSILFNKLEEILFSAAKGYQEKSQNEPSAVLWNIKRYEPYCQSRDGYKLDWNRRGASAHVQDEEKRFVTCCDYWNQKQRDSRPTGRSIETYSIKASYAATNCQKLTPVKPKLGILHPLMCLSLHLQYY